PIRLLSFGARHYPPATLRQIPRHTHRAETGSKQRFRHAPAGSSRIRTAMGFRIRGDDVRRARRRSFASVPGCQLWRAEAILATTSLPRDSRRGVARAKSGPRLAASKSDNPSYVHLRFAQATKW